MAALAASALIVTRAAVEPIGAHALLVPFGVSFGLVVLVLVRQGITVLENERLLRMEQQRAEELAVAHQVAEKQRQLLAERTERLARDIDHLKEVHAQFARGDHAARARIETGELLAISGSLNLMLERLSHLNRANIEYTRLEHAMQLVIEAAQGLAMGDERALSGLAAPTNTPLDAVALALGQLRTRLSDLSAGLRRLDLPRRASRELTELAIQQGQFITAESTVLGKMTEELGDMAKEIEHAAQFLERHFSTLAQASRPLLQVVGLLQLVERTARQQVATLEEQMARFVQAEGRANKAASEGRWLAAELDTAARSGGSRVAMSMPGMAEVSAAAPGVSRGPSAPIPVQQSPGEGSVADAPEGRDGVSA
jgi:HAMP domain-containing protein